MKLSIIIPTYNEESTIEKLIPLLASVSYPVEYEIIVVDDGSTDRTIEKSISELKGKIDLRLLRNTENKGKGVCIRRGLDCASGDIIVIQDADLEYDPNDIPALIQPIINGKAVVVYGSRFLGRSYPHGMSLMSYIANRFLTAITNLLYSTNLTDMETCYKVIRMDVVKDMTLEAVRFEFEPEITAKIVKKNISIYELPISYSGRSHREGKKIRMRDFFIALHTLFRYRFAD